MKKIIMILGMAAIMAACDNKRETEYDTDADDVEMNDDMESDDMDGTADASVSANSTSANAMVVVKYDHTKPYTFEGSTLERKDAILDVSHDLDVTIKRYETEQKITDEDVLEKFAEAREKIAEAREKLVKADEKSMKGDTDDAIEKVEKAIEKLDEAREKYAEGLEKLAKN